MFLSPEDIQALWLSVRVASVATLLALPCAFGLSWLLVFSRVRGKVLIDGLINLPLVLPPVVVGYLLLLLLGRHGVFGALLERLHINIVFNWKGAVLACAVIGLPLMVRAIRLGMERIDPDLLHAARSFGAGRCDTLYSVVLPLCLPAIWTGASLCFARSLGEFGATVILAGNIPGVTQTIPLAIYDYTNTPGGDSAALVLCLVSIALSYLVLMINELLQRRYRL